MKINKKVLCTMIMTGAVMMCTNIANAAGIGYIELSKVLKILYLCTTNKHRS